MFLFLNKIKPWEWILVAALVAASLAGWLAVDKYLTERDKNVQLSSTLSTTKATNTVQAKITSITDQAIADVFAANVKKQADLVVSRHGVIDEYLAADPVPEAVVEPTRVVPTVRPDTPAHAVVKNVPARKPAASTARPASKPALARAVASTARVDRPDDRLNRLADRMQQRYCQALPGSSGCHNSQGTAPALPG